MSNPAEPVYSYIRCVREAVPTSELDEFLVRAAAIGRRLFGVTRGVMVHEPVPREVELEPGYVPTYRGEAVPRVRVFDAQTLCATLFERRAPAGEVANDVLTRAYNRVTASTIAGGRPKRTQTGKRQEVRRANPLPAELRKIEIDHGVGHAVMGVSVTGVTESTKSDYRSRGREYALTIGAPEEAVTVLKGQAEAIDAGLRKVVACLPLFTAPEFSDDSNELWVPFVHVPEAAAEQHEQFLDELDAAARHVSFGLSAPEWTSKVRSAPLE